jgi:hypothetical protein
MPSFDPLEIQRLDDDARRKTNAEEQSRSTRAPYRDDSETRAHRYNVIEIASFQPRASRQRD